MQPEDILIPETLLPAGQMELLPASDSRIPAQLKDFKADDVLVLLVNAASSDTETVVLAVHVNPLKFDLYRNAVLLVSVNDRQLLHFEHKKTKAAQGDAIDAEEEHRIRHGDKVCMKVFIV